MKKVVAVFLSLMMVILCMSVYAEEAEVADASTDVQTAPVTIDPELVLGDWYGETFGTVINICLNEDGTAKCFVGGTETSDDLIWSLQGEIVTVAGSDGSDPLSGPYTDGTLPLASEDGMQVLFVREKIEIYSPAEVNTEATVEDFNGSWNGTYAYTSGTMVSLEGISDERCMISDGKVVFAGNESSMVMLFGEKPVELEFKDGVLEYSQVFGEGDESIFIALKFALLQDGLLSVTIVMDEEPAVMYFTKSGDVDLSAFAASAVAGIVAGGSAITEAVDDTSKALDGAGVGLIEGVKAAVDAATEAMNDEGSEEPTAEAEIKEDITKEETKEDEDLTDASFFHDPEGWVLDGEMNLTSELLDIFDKAMASEKRFAIQPVLHLGTKTEEDFVQHCYLCVLGSLEDPDVESLFMIYINEPADGEPAFYAGLELMLTLSPYEEAEHAEE